MASKLHNILRSLYQKPILQQPSRIGQQHSSKRFLNESLKRNIEQFQHDDGVPVYLKGGFGDKAIFMTTVVLCVVGYLESAHCIYILAFPRKK